MTLLSDIYDVTLKRENRGAAKDGYIRPTLGEYFVTNKDFQQIYSNFLYPTSWDPEKSAACGMIDFNRTIDGWPSNGVTTLSKFGATENKYYWEVKVSYDTGWNGDAYVGISRAPVNYGSTTGGITGTLSLRSTGTVIKDTVSVATGLTVWENDSLTYTIGVALDADNQTVQFWLDGVSQGVYDYSDLDLTGPVYACVGNGLREANMQLMEANFGQSPFTYPVPIGHEEGFGDLVADLNAIRLLNAGGDTAVTIIDDTTCTCGAWQAAIIPNVKNTGKWYVEINNAPTNSLTIGVTRPDWNNASDLQTEDTTLSYTIGTTGADRIKADGVDAINWSPTRSTTDTLGIAYDADNYTFYLYINGVYEIEYTQNNFTNRLSEFVFAIGAYGGKTLYVNSEPQYEIPEFTYIGM